jgi:nucleoside-triphosphatase THEP1
VTATQNTFRKRDVVIALAEACRRGITADQLDAMAERLLGASEVVPITFGLDRRFTTLELLAAEEQIVREAERGRNQGAAVIDDHQLHSALARLPYRLSSEQHRAVTAITRSGNRVDVLEALAGTGKTTCAAALREAYAQAGYKVLGTAPTGRAVRELKERAGITESRTLDGWAAKLAADSDALARDRLRPAVLIIDEAGMAHTRVSAKVMERALAAEIKIVAIGDSGQLSAVGAGGWLAALTRRVGANELREVIRQRDVRERRALAKVHRGEPEPYLELKRERGELRLFEDGQPGLEAEQALIERWAAACERYGEEQAVMICRDNARRDRLNAHARSQLGEQGKLGEEVEIAGQRWAVGDRVIARRNDRGRDLDNGMRATITAADEQRGLVVRLDAGDPRRLDIDYVREHLEHAYALTAHSMQGATVEWAGVIGQPRDFSRNWSYTAFSRAREPVEIFVATEQTVLQAERAEIAPGEHDDHAQDMLARMQARMREREHEDLAVEQLERAELEAELISPIRKRLSEFDARLKTINEQLRDPAIEEAKIIMRLEDTMAAVEREAERDAKPHGWRDRAGYKMRRQEREQHLASLREQRDSLLERVPQARTVLDHAEAVEERRRTLAAEHMAMRAEAIGDEVAMRAPWLEETLGPEPQDRYLRERWHKTAREIAGHRIDHGITEPHTAIGAHLRDHALRRSLADTRAALGLDLHGRAHDTGYEV